MSVAMRSDKTALPEDLAQAVDNPIMRKTQDHPVRLQKSELLELLESQTKKIRADLIEVLDSRLTDQTRARKAKSSFLSSIFHRASSKHSESNLKAPQHRDGLQVENENLRMKNEMLLIEKNDTQQQMEILGQQIRELQKENGASRQETKRLNLNVKEINAHNFKLRQQLTRVDSEQTDDFEVVQKFGRLRYNIIAFVRQTWTLDLKDNVDITKLSGDQRAFFESVEPRDYDRFRSIVFDFICTIIFDSKPYFLGAESKDLDVKIGMMEKRLQENTTPEVHKHLIEWRLASFKLTENLRDNGESLSCDAQRKVWEFFGVVQPKSLEAEHQGMERLRAICDDAVELSLMIRRSKDGFKIDKLARAVHQSASEWGDRAEEIVSVPGSKNIRPGTIAYVITGALVKSSKENPEKELVLEKAEVAVFE